MSGEAAGIALEDDLREGPALAKTLGERLRSPVGAEPRRPPRPVEEARRRCHPAGRRQRREQGVGRRPADLERLGHRAERFVDPAELGGGQPHRPVEPVRVETEEPRRGHGAAEPAERRRGVPAGPVVPGGQGLGDPAHHLRTQREGAEHRTAPEPARLGESHEPGKDRRRQVTRQVQVDVVVVEGVGRDAVEERRRHRRRRPGRAEHGRRAGRLVQDFAEPSGHRLRRPRDGHAPPVEGGQARHLDDGLREIVEARLGDELEERPARPRHHAPAAAGVAPDPPAAIWAKKAFARWPTSLRERSSLCVASPHSWPKGSATLA